MTREGSECCGLVGRFWGHAFAPRFAMVERDKRVEHFTGEIQGASRETIGAVEQTYLGEICTRCGIRQPAEKAS